MSSTTLPAPGEKQLAELTLDEIKDRYPRDGFAFPYRAMPAEEAARYRVEIEHLLASDERSHNYARSQAHLVFPLIDRLTRDARILDAVEVVLGPDLLLWGSGFFLKPPDTANFVSWHQDLTYWGLDGTDEVSAWLALTPVTVENGCMRFMPGSHLDGIHEHTDTFGDDNLLTRGQVLAEDIDESKAVQVTLEPGELSLHHGRMFHASGPNTTNEWRLGLAMQYLAPSMRQVVARKDFAQLVRGVDRFGHFEAPPRPAVNFDEAGLAAHELAGTTLIDALYVGAEKRPDSGEFLES